MPHVSLKTPRPSGHLTFELIPKGTWYVNVRSEFSKENWDRIRHYVYQRAGYACQVCGGTGDKWPVECHESWSFAVGLDGKGTQRLVGFVALCPKCHQVKHLGHSRNTLSETKFEKILSHQRRVNKWNKIQQSREWIKARDEYRRRSALKWEVDISHAKRLLAKILVEEER